MDLRMDSGLDESEVTTVDDTSSPLLDPKACAKVPLLAGVNEATAWRKVLPFLPNMSGEFIRLG